MKTRTKLATAILLAVAANTTYAEDKCFPPAENRQTIVDVLGCFQSVQDAQRRKIGELTAENKKQQGQIAELKQENQRLQKLTDSTTYVKTLMKAKHGNGDSMPLS